MNLGVIIGVVATFVALIIGIPITYAAGRRSRQLPDLRYSVNFDIILKPDEKLLDRGLTMTVGSQPINSISRTRIAFWNHRGDTVRSADIVSSDPLRIQFQEDNTPLQTRTLATSREQTNLATSINSISRDFVDITFDFLDAGDGAVFEIVQEGFKRPEVTGTIMGAKISKGPAADLAPSQLAATAVWSPIRVIKHMVVPWMIFGTVIAVGILLTFAAIHGGNHVNDLVNVKNYNLHTYQGQQDFSAAAQNVPQPVNRTGAIVGLGIALGIIVIWILSYLHIRQQRMPLSIVAHQYRTP